MINDVQSSLASAGLRTVIRKLVWSPEDLVNLNDRAFAGQADLRDDQPPETAAGGSQVDGCGLPSTFPRGHHTPGPGQSRITHVAVPSRAAPELARGRSPPGRRDAARPPACKIDTRAVAGPSNVEKY
jgi:hypothetical protein